jgi:hypothetical protein
VTRALLLAALLAACKESGDMLPISPGGGGRGGVTQPDAALEGDGGADIQGRVCLLSDPRDPVACAASGADGLTVTLGASTATTASDGSFTIARPPGTNLTWIVNGTGVEPSAMRAALGTTVPVIGSLLYGDMIAGMSAVVTTEDGAIISQLRRNDAAFTDAIAVATPVPDSEVYYDGPALSEWDFDATGPFGVVWISAIAPGIASLALDNGTVQTTVAGIPVFAGTITFELAEIP